MFEKNYLELQFSVYENKKSPSTFSKYFEMHPKNLRKLIQNNEKHQNISKENKNCRNKGIQSLISHQAANS